MLQQCFSLSGLGHIGLPYKWTRQDDLLSMSFSLVEKRDMMTWLDADAEEAVYGEWQSLTQYASLW